MSVAFARAFIAGMRYNGVHVDFERDWEQRGNGQSFPDGQPWGPLTHHTGASYGGGYSILVHGRSDLPGPLCNIATWPDGHITLIAAHPANHAGAAGGSWARPYPDTRSFNRLVWGNEVMYPGFQPWTPEQYRTARIAAAVVCGIRRRSSAWAKGHYETSVTGKWDPGIGNGRAEWFPMGRFRNEMAAALRDTTPAPPPPPPPPPKPKRLLEDQTMERRTPAPDGDDSNTSPVKDGWPAEWVTIGYDPDSTRRLNLAFAFPGGYVHEAKWWLYPKGGRGQPTRNPGGIDIGKWAHGGPQWGASTISWDAHPDGDMLEIRLSAPGGVHIYPTPK